MTFSTLETGIALTEAQETRRKGWFNRNINEPIDRGLQPFSKWGRHTVYNRIEQALEQNPLTLQEIKEYIQSKRLPNLSRLIKQGKVRRLGAIRSPVYYLPGQEDRVLTKLEASDRTEDKLIEALLTFLKEPRTFEEIKATFPSAIKSQKILKDLGKANIIFKRRFTLSGGKHRYNALTLFGDLAFKTYYCRLDAADEFASFIIKKRQLKLPVHSGFRHSLTAQLKTLLPKKVFTVVHARMSTKQ